MKEKINTEEYFKYIEHRYKPVGKVGTWFYNKLVGTYFSSIEFIGKENLPPRALSLPRESDKEPIYVYMLRHRSEFDYSVFLTQLKKLGRFVITQAGDNLFFGPFDKFLRKKGAFKVIRLKGKDEKKKIYSDNWYLNVCYKQLAKSRFFQRFIKAPEPRIFTKKYTEKCMKIT